MQKRERLVTCGPAEGSGPALQLASRFAWAVLLLERGSADISAPLLLIFWSNQQRAHL